MLVPASSELVEPGWLGFPGKKKNLLFHPEFFSKYFNVVRIHNLDLLSVCSVLCMCTTGFFSVVNVHN